MGTGPEVCPVCGGQAEAAVDGSSALLASEERYRLLAENATDVVFRITPDGVVDWISVGSERVLGWTADEVIGRSGFDFTDVRDLDAARVAFAQFVDGSLDCFRYRVVAKGGASRWIEARVRPVRDEQGALTMLDGGWRDVQDEQDALEALQQSEKRYRLLAENASDVVVRMGLDGTVLWTSSGVLDILGWDPSEVVDRPGTDFIDPRDLAWAMSNLTAMHDGAPRAVRMRMFCKGGGSRWIESRVKPIVADDGEVVEFVGGWRDVDSEVRAHLELEQRARRDTLTGLINRGTGIDQLAELLRGVRDGTSELAVAFCDLDAFKSVNDTHGHAAGDHLLMVVAERLLTCIREGDVAVRFGGDELLVLLRGVADLDTAAAVAETIRSVLSLPIPYRDRHLACTVTIGVTLAREDDDVDSLVARADAAMYGGKQQGRDRVVPIP